MSIQNGGPDLTDDISEMKMVHSVCGQQNSCFREREFGEHDDFTGKIFRGNAEQSE